MNIDLKNFLQPLLQVVAVTLFAVFTVAFLSLPYTLGSTPGQSNPSSLSAPRHMT